MRKFWKIENNVNVRKSETLKSRKAVNEKIKRPLNTDWSHPKGKVAISFDNVKEAIINMKDLYGINRTRDFLKTYGYDKISDIHAFDYEKILRATRLKIYEYTH